MNTLSQTAKPAPAADASPSPAGDRKLQIEQAALDLAYAHGPAAVSTGMIARQIGLSQPAIYKHFKRKEDIWQAVAARLAQQIHKNITASHNGGLPAPGGLRQLVGAHLEFLQRYPALPEIMTMRADAGGKNSFQGIIQAAMREFHLSLARHVELAQKQKRFRKNICTTDAATLILGLIQSLALRSLVSRDLDILANDGERLLELLLAGFQQYGEST